VAHPTGKKGFLHKPRHRKILSRFFSISVTSCFFEFVLSFRFSEQRKVKLTVPYEGFQQQNTSPTNNQGISEPDHFECTIAINNLQVPYQLISPIILCIHIYIYIYIYSHRKVSDPPIYLYIISSVRIHFGENVQ